MFLGRIWQEGYTESQRRRFISATARPPDEWEAGRLIIVAVVLPSLAAIAGSIKNRSVFGKMTESECHGTRGNINHPIDGRTTRTLTGPGGIKHLGGQHLS